MTQGNPGGTSAPSAAHRSGEQPGAEPARPAAPPITVASLRPGSTFRRPPISRSADRRLTALGIGLAATFVLLAGLALLLPADVRLGWWLPVHLVLAGAAATAISGVMPFFSAAVAAAPPAPSPLRLSGILGVATGGLLVAISRSLGDAGPWVGGGGGLIYLAGLTAVAGSTLLPLRSALGPRRFVMGISYGAAIASVWIGAGLGTLYLSRWREVLEAWDVIKPAHAWLNAFGFVSLVIGASLIHLLPTVAGTRIERTRAAVTAMVALALGPVLAASGFLVRLDPLAMGGALLTLAGALALGRHAIDVYRRRGRWTTDPAWHRFGLWSLLAAVAWFVIASALGAWSVITGGASGAGWEARLVLAPLVLGWVAQTLVGAWTHLLPAVGPGDQSVHARQRAILARGATARFWAFQAGVAALAVALPGGWADQLLGDAGPLVMAGLLVAGGSVAASLALLLAAGLVIRSGRGASGGD